MRTLSSLVMLLAFVLTNRWMDWDSGIVYMHYQDVYTYMKMAESFPGFYSGNLPGHILQRFFVPYVAGAMTHLTGMEVSTSFTLLAALFASLLIWIYDRILRDLRLPTERYQLCMALLIFNPYILRYHALVPGMANGLLFLAGAGWVLLGLLRVNSTQTLLGTLAMTLGRQTAILLIPTVCLWILFVPGWKRRPLRHRVRDCILTSTLNLGFFLASLYPASLSTRKLALVGHATDLFRWIHPDARWDLLAELVARVWIPFTAVTAGTLAVMLAARRAKTFAKGPSLEFWLSAGSAFLITLQPLLAGPGKTNTSGTRLGMMGLLPALVAFAILLRDYQPVLAKVKRSWYLHACVLAVAFVGSFHHMYTIWGPSSLTGLVTLQCGVATLLGLLAYGHLRAQRA